VPCLLRTWEIITKHKIRIQSWYQKKFRKIPCNRWKKWRIGECRQTIFDATLTKLALVLKTRAEFISGLTAFNSVSTLAIFYKFLSIRDKYCSSITGREVLFRIINNLSANQSFGEFLLESWNACFCLCFCGPLKSRGLKEAIFSRQKASAATPAHWHFPRLSLGRASQLTW